MDSPDYWNVQYVHEYATDGYVHHQTENISKSKGNEIYINILQEIGNLNKRGRKYWTL